MKLNVEHKDINGNINHLVFDLSLPEFILYLSYAGLGSRHSKLKKIRYVSNMYKYALFWNNKNFKLPKIIMSDPTAVGQLSNEIGLAISNFLATKIYNANYSINYEYLMNINKHVLNQTQRPDLYCIDRSGQKQFALEAKGTKKQKIYASDIADAKQQASSGPLRIHFCVASIAYDLYDKPKVKFHDPVGSDFPFEEEKFHKVQEYHYEMILNFLEKYKREDFDNEYYKYTIPFPFEKDSAFGFKHPLVSFVLNKNIMYGKYEQSENINLVNEENLFINEDGVGILIEYLNS